MHNTQIPCIPIDTRLAMEKNNSIELKGGKTKCSRLHELHTMPNLVWSMWNHATLTIGIYQLILTGMAAGLSKSGLEGRACSSTALGSLKSVLQLWSDLP